MSTTTQELRIAVPSVGATLGRKQAEFATYKTYMAPTIEGGQPIWFSNMSFLKENKETGEAYLQGLVDNGLLHSFVSAEVETERIQVNSSDIANIFAKLRS